MLSGLEIVLSFAALLIGLTGAWSPCGFSMVETIGPTGHAGGRPTTAAALATFIPGALVGGILTFGALAWLGGVVHGAGGRVAYGVAAAIAIAAAVAEARGVPIIPQIRRQLPEHWRRVMPMPLAAGLYGVLLGLGFTTFVLSFGVWALAGIAFAIGDPTGGIVIGLAFGAGRAIPVLALAPVCDRPSGIRAMAAMTERPALYRGARRGDAIALAVTAIALMVSPAGAATNAVKGASDPSVAGAGDFAFTRADGAAILERGGERVRVPGTDIAIGGRFAAVVRGSQIVVLFRRDLSEYGSLQAPGVTALAINGSFLAYRDDGASRIQAVHLIGNGDFGPPIPAAEVKSPSTLGRPFVDDQNRMTYARAGLNGSSILLSNLVTGKTRTAFSTRQWLLSAPSTSGGSLAYVRTTNNAQQVRTRRIRGGHDRLVFSLPSTAIKDADHDPHHTRLHTRVAPPDRHRTNRTITGTLLTKGRVFMTLLVHRGARVAPSITSVHR